MCFEECTGDRAAWRWRHWALRGVGAVTDVWCLVLCRAGGSAVRARCPTHVISIHVSNTLKQSNPITGLDRPQKVPGGWSSQIARESALECGKVSPTQRPPLPPGCIPGNHGAARSFMSMRNTNNTIGNRTRNLRACRGVLNQLQTVLGPTSAGE
jgi:hypothetical protein